MYYTIYFWKLSYVNGQGDTSIGYNKRIRVLQVYYCKEDEVCLYQSLVFEVPFKEVSAESTPQEIKLPFVVKPKSSEGALQLPIAK